MAWPMRSIRPLVARPALTLAAVATALLLSACSSQDNDTGQTGMTQGESKALDDAAQMIEERRLPPDAIESPDASAPSTAASEAAADK